MKVLQSPTIRQMVLPHGFIVLLLAILLHCWRFRKHETEIETPFNVVVGLSEYCVLAFDIKIPINTHLTWFAFCMVVIGAAPFMQSKLVVRE